MYDLYAVSNHFGGLGGGHYTAYVRMPGIDEDGGWYNFDDSRTSGPVPEREVWQCACDWAILGGICHCVYLGLAITHLKLHALNCFFGGTGGVPCGVPAVLPPPLGGAGRRRCVKPWF